MTDAITEIAEQIRIDNDGDETCRTPSLAELDATMNRFKQMQKQSSVDVFPIGPLTGVFMAATGEQSSGASGRSLDRSNPCDDLAT